MGPCCVEGCEVTADETYYFEFPTSRQLRRRWLELTRVPGKLPLGAVVCSKHFRADDYELVRGKVRLKRKVLPSLLLDEIQPKPKEKSPEPTKSPPRPKSPKSPLPTSPKSPIPPKSPKVTAACDSTVSDLPGDEQTDKQTDKHTDKHTDKQADKHTDKQADKKQDKQRHKQSDKQTDKQTDKQADKQTDKQSDKHTPDARLSTESADICKVVNNKNGRWDSHNIDLNSVPLPDPKQDIEDMITNYQIKNKPNTAHLPDLPLAPTMDLIGASETETIEIDDKDPVFIEISVDKGASETETIEIDDKDPVFIEISVDKDNPAGGGGSQDCLMVLESVQVDVDPSSLMLPDMHDDMHDIHDSHDAHDAHDRKEDPISLLTSSDEDDVIIQEPHIDTVEVSDETDEDDVPLVKLVKKTPLKKKLLKKKTKKLLKSNEALEMMWKMVDFYCMQCTYSTNSSVEYNNHINEHSTVLQVCPICGYTSASKTMFSRHVRKHREEKKFRCHICDYRAKHNMSLIYHLKSHDSANLESVKRGFKCKKCGFQSDVKATVLKHVRLCSTGVKKYSCDKCVYETKRWSDLKRHLSRRHKEYLEEEDLVADGDWP